MGPARLELHAKESRRFPCQLDHVIIHNMIITIAILSQKGGSGKTTLALALAVAHELAGQSAAVIDLDAQGSSVTWGRLRGGESPPVIPAHPPRLARVIAAAREAGAGLAVIDTAPREAGGAVAAARSADMVLVTCRPSAVDLATIPASLAAAELTQARVSVVLNGCPPRGSWTAEAADAIRGFGAALCPVTIGARVAHARAFTVGCTAQEVEPKSRAAQEVTALYRWIMEAT